MRTCPLPFVRGSHILCSLTAKSQISSDCINYQCRFVFMVPHNNTRLDCLVVYVSACGDDLVIKNCCIISCCDWLWGMVPDLFCWNVVCIADGPMKVGAHLVVPSGVVAICKQGLAARNEMTR